MDIKDFKKTFKLAKKYYNNLEVNDLLGYVGLQQKSSALDYVLPAVGLVAAGVAVGVGIGMALAPKAGADLRSDVKDDLKQKVNDIRERVTTATNTTSANLHS